MKQTDPQIKLRLPPRLKERIEEQAAANSRTMTSEIIERLRWSFDAGYDADSYAKFLDTRSKAAAAKVLRMNLKMDGGPADPLEDRVTKLEKAVSELANAKKP